MMNRTRVGGENFRPKQYRQVYLSLACLRERNAKIRWIALRQIEPPRKLIDSFLAVHKQRHYHANILIFHLFIVLYEKKSEGWDDEVMRK